MGTPTLSPALPAAPYQYPLKVVELRNHANGISKKVKELKSKPDSTPGQIYAHALSITVAVESACAGRSLEVLEPFAVVAVEEIVRLFSLCCLALDAASQKRGFGAKLTALTSRVISPSPVESTNLNDYRVSLEAVKVLLRLKIENGQSLLVCNGTIGPLAAQSPTLLQYVHNDLLYASFELTPRTSSEISKSTVVDEVFKTALQTMMNITDGLPFPYKAVVQTVLQFHEHIKSYRQIDDSVGALMSKIDDFVKIVAKPGGRKINSGQETAKAIETFFRAIQSIIVRLEILKATRRVKRFAAPDAVKAALAEADATLAHAQTVFNSSDVNYSSELPTSPKFLHGRDEELRSLVAFVIDRSRPIRVAIMGAGGLGKTTLANAVVNHAEVSMTFGRSRFFVTADAAAGVDDLLAGMLNTFGMPASSDPLASLLNNLRSRGPTLLVIDNFETIWNSKHAEQRSRTERVLTQLDAVDSLTLIITCRGTVPPPNITWVNRDMIALSVVSAEAALAMFRDIAGDLAMPGQSDQSVGDERLWAADRDSGNVHRSDKEILDSLLYAVNYMPLAVTLLARLVADGEELRDLDMRWRSVSTTMLSPQSNGRLDNVEVSIQLSLDYLPDGLSAPLQLLSLCAQLPDGMRLSVREELGRRLRRDFRDIDGALKVIQRLALVYLTEDKTIRMLSPIRLYVLEKHKPQADHRASLLQIYYEIAMQAPWRIDSQFPAARDKILPELSNLEALLLSEIQNFDELPSTDLIEAVTAVSCFSSHHVPNARMLTALIPRIEHLPVYLAYSLSILGNIHWRRDAYDLSLEAATRARSLYQSLQQRSHVADCDRRMGDVHRLKGNYAEAIASLSAARKTFYELDGQLAVAYCDRDLALVFCEQENYEDAAALFTSAREVFLRLDEPADAAFCQEQLGGIQRMRGDYQAAETQLESALQTYTSLGSMRNIASCSCLLGNVYRLQRHFNAALERLQVAYDISQKQGDTLHIADALRLRSYVHQDQGEFAQARRLLLDAQRLYESVENTGGLEQCAKGLDELKRAEQA
ncbi:hypothetical protein EXIGLDRAFT_748647 [Exidia glandulosa HHB12029]|uniref:Novel STAND NTPase 1 domain-containing protein n=1 Tax=Exidia glandulosa HHB12029 TaxID=1314781 RepID=A0A165J6Q2_EXIGL|nr:hypothetical protein EXIGLDRAFT_748647 [Exidia glandulosa HHB12029]